MIKRILFVVLSVALVGTSVGAKTPPGITEVRTVEGVTEYRLGNGMQVLLYPDPSKPTITVNVTYKVGSRHENYGETGMAHLLEHLLFKGSKNYPNPEKEFSRRGFQNNATTYFDRTNYFSTFQASGDNLRWALGWKADAMTNSFIAKKDLDSEMTVVRNEFEMGENDPTRVMFKRMLSMMFDWHNYSNSTIGNRSDIENVGIGNLQAFYRTYYQPDNASLIVAGKFDPDKTLALIAQTFGNIPAPKRSLPKLWTVEPTQDGERTFMVRRQGDVQTVWIGYRIPAQMSDNSAAISAAAEILSNTPNGRLHKEVVEAGLAARIFAWPIQLSDPGMLLVGAVVKRGDSPEKARDKMIEVLENTFAKQPPTAEEMERMRTSSETAFERSLADPQDFAISLSEAIASGDWRLFFLTRNQAQTVTPEQIAKAAAHYFRRDNRTVGIFVPEDNPQRAAMEPTLSAAAMLKDFQPRATVAAGEAFDPSQANIDARTRRLAFGNLKVALLSKKNRGETVSVLVNPRWGDVKTLTGKSVVAFLTDGMIERGTSKMTRQQIADEKTRLKMQGSVRAFQTDRAHVLDAMRLSAHVMREANFPAGEFDLLKREIITALQAQLNDPVARSRDALRMHFNTYPEGDPRAYIPLSRRIELVEKTTLDDVKQFHAQFWGTARGEVVLVGDFDDKAAEALIKEQFAGWQSKAPYEQILSEPREVKAERIFVDTPDKENAFYRSRINLVLRDDDPEYAALLLADYIFGGGSGLANRLITRLRQQDGISYSVGSALLVGSRDRASAWQFGALVAPQNAVKAEQAVSEEIARLLKTGLTDKEIADAKNGLLQARQLERSDDAALRNTWGEYLDLGRTFTSYSLALEERIKALTTEQVNAAVRKHFDASKLTVVVAGDAKKGAK